MKKLIEEFILSKFNDTTIVEELSGNIVGMNGNNKFFLYEKKNDTLYFDFRDFNTMKNLFDISELSCVSYIKNVFRDKGIPFSVFLPIIGTGVYWYSLESYV